MGDYERGLTTAMLTAARDAVLAAETQLGRAGRGDIVVELAVMVTRLRELRDAIRSDTLDALVARYAAGS